MLKGSLLFTFTDKCYIWASLWFQCYDIVLLIKYLIFDDLSTVLLMTYIAIDLINDLLTILLMTYWPYYWWPIDLFQDIIVSLWLYWNQKECVRRDTTVQRVLPVLCFLIVQWEPTVQQEVLYQRYVQMVSLKHEHFIKFDVG